jgi:hypothetical protein
MDWWTHNHTTLPDEIDRILVTIDETTWANRDEIANAYACPSTSPRRLPCGELSTEGSDTACSTGETNESRCTPPHTCRLRPHPPRGPTHRRRATVRTIRRVVAELIEHRLLVKFGTVPSKWYVYVSTGLW